MTSSRSILSNVLKKKRKKSFTPSLRNILHRERSHPLNTVVCSQPKPCSASGTEKPKKMFEAYFPFPFQKPPSQREGHLLEICIYVCS